MRVVKIHYRAHNGKRRSAYVVLPAWYGRRKHPRLPLVISPHGRGITGRANARLWGALPARGGFAVVSPDGQGRVLGLQSWGAVGQIDDLADRIAALRRALREAIAAQPERARRLRLKGFEMLSMDDYARITQLENEAVERGYPRLA